MQWHCGRSTYVDCREVDRLGVCTYVVRWALMRVMTAGGASLLTGPENRECDLVQSFAQLRYASRLQIAHDSKSPCGEPLQHSPLTSPYVQYNLMYPDLWAIKVPSTHTSRSVNLLRKGGGAAIQNELSDMSLKFWRVKSKLDTSRLFYVNGTTQQAE